MKLVGTCQSGVKGLEGPACIECDLERHEITVYFRAQGPFGSLVAGDSVLKRAVKLSDIELASHTARFRISHLPSAFFGSVHGGGFSIDDGEIDALLNLNNNDTSVIKLRVVLRTGRLVLEILSEPGTAPPCEELVLTNHGRHESQQFSLTLLGREYQVRYALKRLFIHGRCTPVIRDVLRHTSSLLSLSAESIVGHLCPPRVVLNMSLSDTPRHAEKVIAKADLPLVFQQVAARLLAMSESQRKTTYNEMSYVVSGFDQSHLLEDRTTSLFKALESFDGCRTLSPDRCSALLAVRRDDARFLCDVRNNVFHSGMSLAEAGITAFKKLSRQPNVNLRKFATVRPGRDLPWKLYVSISRLIGSAYFCHLGVSQPVSIFSWVRTY